MTQRVLVAGLGNVSFGDDGFGVEVAQRLAREPIPEGVAVVDFGVRAMHLALELLDEPDLLVLVDAAARGGVPGTLYVIDPEMELKDVRRALPDGHTVNPFAVLAILRWVRGRLPPTRIVGCEPGELSEPMRLSDSVKEAVEPAMNIVRRLIDSERGPLP